MNPDARQILVALGLVISPFLTGCDRLPSGAIGSEMAVVPSRGWYPDAPVEFTPVTYDTVSPPAPPYELVIHVRYLRSCPERELRLAVQEMSLAEGYRPADTITIPLAGADGKPVGRGGYNIFETCDTLRSGFTLPEGYTVTLAPVSAVAGVISVGYSLLDKNSVPTLVVY